MYIFFFITDDSSFKASENSLSMSTAPQPSSGSWAGQALGTCPWARSPHLAHTTLTLSLHSDTQFSLSRGSALSNLCSLCLAHSFPSSYPSGPWSGRIHGSPSWSPPLRWVPAPLLSRCPCLPGPQAHFVCMSSFTEHGFNVLPTLL